MRALLDSWNILPIVWETQRKAGLCSKWYPICPEVTKISEKHIKTAVSWQQTTWPGPTDSHQSPSVVKNQAPPINWQSIGKLWHPEGYILQHAFLCGYWRFSTNWSFNRIGIYLGILWDEVNKDIPKFYHDVDKPKKPSARNLCLVGFSSWVADVVHCKNTMLYRATKRRVFSIRWGIFYDMKILNVNKTQDG